MLYLLTLLLALVRLALSTFDSELHEKFSSMPLEEFIEYFNQQNYSWTIASYPKLTGKNLYGTFLNRRRDTDFETIFHDAELYHSLPENFDSRINWSQCDTIKEIYNQGDCESCWAFGTANVASDRMCIHKGYTVRLAEQDFECLPDVCSGGYSSVAFEHWRDSGLVTRECKPYNIKELREETCTKECNDKNINYTQDKHFGENVYFISSDENDIRTELSKNGPVQVGFQVYQDIVFYQNGVYDHKFGKLLGGHSVRVIGYGVENGVSYWLVANSWGDNGYVKIKRYQDNIEFEMYLLAGIPKN